LAKIIPLSKSFVFSERFEHCIKSGDERCLEQLIEEIEKHLIIKPNDEDSLLVLVYALQYLGRTDEAIQRIESYLSTYGGASPYLILQLSSLYVDKLDFRKALLIAENLERFCKESNLPEEFMNRVIAQKAVIFYNMRDIESICKLFESFGEEKLTELLFNTLPSSTASNILSFYRGYQKGLKLLSKNKWIREAFEKLKETYGKEHVYLVVESDLEYPDWETPCFYILRELPCLPIEELAKWKLKEEDKAFELIEPFIRKADELMLVQIGGSVRC